MAQTAKLLQKKKWRIRILHSTSKSFPLTLRSLTFTQVTELPLIFSAYTNIYRSQSWQTRRQICRSCVRKTCMSMVHMNLFLNHAQSSNNTPLSISTAVYPYFIPACFNTKLQYFFIIHKRSSHETFKAFSWALPALKAQRYKNELSYVIAWGGVKNKIQ